MARGDEYYAFDLDVRCGMWPSFGFAVALFVRDTAIGEAKKRRGLHSRGRSHGVAKKRILAGELAGDRTGKGT